MKSSSVLCTFLIVFFSINASNSQVGIGTNTPAPSAQLDISSTERGLLMPRMTMAQRNLIASPATGLTIYQTDNTAGFYFFDGSNWLTLGAAGVDGKNTLIKTTTETAGSNCTSGGVKQEYGLDANSNGILDVSEVNSAMTKYVCNGSATNTFTPPVRSTYQLSQELNLFPTNSLVYNVTERSLYIKSDNSTNSIPLNVLVGPVSYIATSSAPDHYLLSFNVSDTLVLKSANASFFNFQVYVDNDNLLTNSIGSQLGTLTTMNSQQIVLIPNENYRIRINYSGSSSNYGTIGTSYFSQSPNNLLNMQFHKFQNSAYSTTSFFPYPISNPSSSAEYFISIFGTGSSYKWLKL